MTAVWPAGPQMQSRPLSAERMLYERQPDLDHCARPRRAGDDLQTAAMTLQGGAGDGEPQAVALLLTRAVAAGERREQPRQRIDRKTGAGVDHLDPRIIVLARHSDILQQFLMICVVDGVVGDALPLPTSVVFNSVSDNFKMNISMLSLVVAFACSTLVGVAFGFLPARNAARMNPVEALARE